MPKPNDDLPEVPKWPKEQLEKALAWIKEKWGDEPSCPQCGTGSWGVADSPVSLFITKPDNAMFIASGAYPCFVVICDNCGNTLLINSIMSGMMKPESKEVSDGGN